MNIEDDNPSDFTQTPQMKLGWRKKLAIAYDYLSVIGSGTSAYIAFYDLDLLTFAWRAADTVFLSGLSFRSVANEVKTIRSSIILGGLGAAHLAIGIGNYLIGIDEPIQYRITWALSYFAKALGEYFHYRDYKECLDPESTKESIE